MKDVIAEYHRWKQQGDGLRAEAMKAMETRYRELLAEAAQLAEEYKADFGVALKLPAGVTAFEYKSAARKAKPVVAAAAVVPPDPKLAPLEKKLAGAQKKLEAVKAAGGVTKNLEDKIYEIEDELRLARVS